MSRYYTYNQHLQDKYGAKTYKLPVNLLLTCPNRDGVLSTGGCAYCGSKGASFEEASVTSVKEQLLEIKEPIANKYKAEKFIAYFQNFTNTYLPLEELKDNVAQALEVEGIVELAFATRPDCINKEYLEAMLAVIEQQAPETNLTLELGLQTANYHILKSINRGHTLAEFIDAVLTAREYGVGVGVHLILNLPGDSREDAIENAKLLSALQVDNVKLHALYIREDTRFGELYQQGKLDLISLEEYIERVILFLEHLDPQIAVQRLLGKAPREGSLFVNWGYDYWTVHNRILDELEKRNIEQGQKFDYLQGKALTKFS